MGTLLGIVAKHWTPGRVKTRLAADIGEQRAAEVQRLFVTTLLRRFGTLADERMLAFDPPGCRDDFEREAGGAWQLQPQDSGDLGRRMEAFFAASLRRAKQVVLIGSDSPDLPERLVEDAFESLNHVEVVLGPAADGGYYLVGAAGHVPPIFADMPWSSTDLWRQTAVRLTDSGCHSRTLGRWYDVDTAVDLAQLRRRLQLHASQEHASVLADRLNLLLADSPL